MASHLSRSALVRLLSDKASPIEVLDMVPHLSSCRPCRDLAIGVVEELKKKNALVRPRDARAALLALLEEEERATRDLLKARARWTELKKLSSEEQIEQIQTVAALRKRPLFEVILDEARSMAPGDPFLGEETALVASALALALPGPEDLRNDLQAEAMIVVANCRRLAADWKGSRAALSAAKNLLARGTGDPAFEARLYSIGASLASDTGLFETALGMLGRAAELYRLAHQPAGLSSIAVKEASTLLAAYRHEEAIVRANEAIALMSPGEARLEMLARSIITECLTYLGRTSEALSSFRDTRFLYDQFRSRRTDLMVAYLEALLLDSKGCFRDSERYFHELISGYIEEELYKDAFLTLLTYFEVLVKRRAYSKARRVYQQAADLLAQAGSGSHEQMREVWRSLLEQIERESLNEHHIRDIRQYVQRHWNVPARRVPAGAH